MNHWRSGVNTFKNCSSKTFGNLAAKQGRNAVQTRVVSQNLSGYTVVSHGKHRVAQIGAFFKPG